MLGKFEGKKITPEARQLEEQREEPLELSTKRPQKRRSILLRRFSLQKSISLSRTQTSEQVIPFMSDVAVTFTPNTSLDQIVAAPSIPPTRRSSFTPGAATRKLSSVAAQQDMQDRKIIEEVEEPDASVAGSDYFHWRPRQSPRTTERVDTPSDMGYSQLGGLRYGSLQIVNGRASPTFSEASKVSKYLLAVQTPYQDVSSEYSDAEEDSEAVALTLRSTNPYETAQRRFSSWSKDEDKTASRTHPLQDVMLSHENDAALSDKDHTSMIANGYIVELGDSPFEQQRSASPVETIRRTRSEGSLWRANSRLSQQSSPSIDKDLGELLFVDPPNQAPSPSGSVLRKIAVGPPMIQGEARQLATDVKPQPCEIVMDWYSPIEPSVPVDEAFRSAIERPAQLSSSKLGLHVPCAPGKTDSGYSSSVSLPSLQVARRTPPPAETAALPDRPASIIADSMPRSSRPRSLLGLRPSMFKSRRTELNIPTLGTLQSKVISTVSLPVGAVSGIWSEADVLETSKPRKKLFKKRRLLSQPPDQISVVQVQPCEDDSIPQVSPQAQENLRRRSQAIPELERTYVRPGLGGNQPNNPAINVSNPEIRFPSPVPEEPRQMSRPRSRSRPRSWFGRAKSDLSVSRRNSGISQAEAIAIINDSGTDGTVMSKGPYDLGNQENVPPRPKKASVVSAAHANPRPMMDDQTAVELSRRRSRTIQERDAMVSGKRQSFNDRGGIPGKHYRAASLGSDVPPITAEMLEKAYRTSSRQRQPAMSTDAAPPPPPPPHSPCPVHSDCQKQTTGLAPPPPSHSRRPVDTGSDHWAVQAVAWKARRKSAGEAMRRQSLDSRRYEQSREIGEFEPLRPAITPRQQPGWTQSISPEVSSLPRKQFHSRYDRSSARPLVQQSRSSDSHSHNNEHESRYMSPSWRKLMAHDTQPPRVPRPKEASPHRSSPSPRPLHGPLSFHPHSDANSARTRNSFTAEELHPQDLKSTPLPPVFGRYSGGLEFGYERANGFGGSAGIRSANGKADASRKGVALRASFGLDLGDVPFGIMADGRPSLQPRGSGLISTL